MGGVFVIGKNPFLIIRYSVDNINYEVIIHENELLLLSTIYVFPRSISNKLVLRVFLTMLEFASCLAVKGKTTFFMHLLL